MEKDYRKEGEEMEKKKRKYSRTDKVILGIGFTILGLFVLSIAIPIIYVVLASFMDPTVLNNQGLYFISCTEKREVSNRIFVRNTETGP